FLGGWHAFWPFNMIPGANTGWWGLIWFTVKVWAFLFVFIWVRASLPRLRYDQFMALGWKILIPVSLVWVMVVATVRALRAQGYHSWAVALIAASAAGGIALLLLFRSMLLRRYVRPGAAEPPAPRYSDFPVPPLPGQPASVPSQESSHA
ncbi:MAG TPA: NADH-quinone oxidoreductase subunit H, partial [Mycobacterium sp.]|nr:NADH-quinone oxidoreductase subunit H [Mycobacterium sp.]